MTGRERVLLFFKGLAMGAADSIPGVSGGTIAFITNIYDELLSAILAVNPQTAKILFTEGPASAWRALNGNFLLTLVAGILLALVCSAHAVSYLLAQQYTYLMCFFSGLIAASVWLVGKQITSWSLPRCLLLGAGIAFSAGLALLPEAKGADSLVYYFFCGAVAICAMILPGISGAFVLLLLGAYEPVINALLNLDWPVIGIFALGCVSGLLSFARLLSWLLSAYRLSTLAVLLGILAGSLFRLWPWRQALPDNVAGLDAGLPYLLGPAYARDVLTGADISFLLCFILVLAGFLLVWGLEAAGSKYGIKSSSSAN